MRTRMAILLAAASGLYGADNQLTAQEKAAGWRLLFDGHSYGHWQGPPPSFNIEDGCLHSIKNPAVHEDLFSADTYGDFELVFDWRISPGGNSGVKYRIQDHAYVVKHPDVRFEDDMRAAMLHRIPRPEEGEDYVVGFEYQITDNQKNSDALTAGPIHQSGALYDVSVPSRDATRPVGEFNHSRLVLRGKRVEHWLNGEKVVDTMLDGPAVAARMAKRWGTDSLIYKLLVEHPKTRCPISLQNHGDECWFKNLKIRPLN